MPARRFPWAWVIAGISTVGFVVMTVIAILFFAVIAHQASEEQKRQQMARSLFGPAQNMLFDDKGWIVRDNNGHDTGIRFGVK